MCLSSVACAATLVHEVTGYTSFFIKFEREYVVEGKEFPRTDVENEVYFDRSKRQINRENSSLRLFENL